MKVLQLCTRVPNPPVDGGSIAMLNLQYALQAQGVQLKVLAFNTIKQPVDVEKLDPAYVQMTNLEAVFLDNRIKPFEAFFNLFSGESYHIVRFIRRDFEELLTRTLQNESFDIIQLESLFMVPYLETIRRLSKAKVVLRTHNIEHQIWERMALTSKNALRKWYLNILAKRLRQYETWALNRLDAILALTAEDERLLIELGTTIPVYVAAIGMDLQRFQVGSTPAEPILFHIGAMDWMPNQEGISWFLEQVWPELIQHHKTVTLRLAGKRMPPVYFKYANERISVADFVPDAAQFMREGRIMIVPLLSGSGMRVKILEGMAMGKCILTTPLGAEGIPAVDGQHLHLAANAEMFTKKLLDLLQHPEKVEKTGREARLFAESHYDNHRIGAQIVSFYRKIIGLNN